MKTEKKKKHLFWNEDSTDGMALRFIVAVIVFMAVSAAASWQSDKEFHVWSRTIGIVSILLAICLEIGYQFFTRNASSMQSRLTDDPAVAQVLPLINKQKVVRKTTYVHRRKHY